MSEPARSQSPGPPNTALLANGLNALSCVTCAKRKVKCDRIEPCTNCQKHNIVCEYRDPAPKGRKRKAPDSASVELRARLEQYEKLLKDKGIDLPVENEPSAHLDVNDDPPSLAKPRKTKQSEQGRLVVQRGRTRYVEGAMWTKMQMKMEDQNSLLEDLTDEDEGDNDLSQSPDGVFEGSDLVLGFTPKAGSLLDLYPPLPHFRKLWQGFKANVHPISMVCHAPTVEKQLLQVYESSDDVTKETEALLFAVIACSILSLDDADCLKAYSESKKSLLARARHGARQALVNAKFLLSSSLTVLQALYFYLLAVRPQVDPRALWNLTGIAVRNGQRLGLHKDHATNGLTPFEIEMRRRLWYQVMSVDLMAAQIAGTSPSADIMRQPIGRPANVNDSDISPDMKELPEDRTGATEMMFCNLRYRMLAYMQNLNKTLPDGSMKLPWNALAELASTAKERMMDDMEKEIELSCLRYCDLLNPVHYLTVYVARLVLTKMRFTAQHPRFVQEGGEMTQELKDTQFTTALRVLQYDNAAHANELMKGFLWHSHAHFQWSCLIHVLDELKTRTTGDEAEKAWSQIAQIYQNRPEITFGRKLRLPLYAAIHKLTLEAWSQREQGAAQVGEYVEVPECISILRDCRNNQAKGKHGGSSGTTPSMTDTASTVPPGSYGMPTPHMEFGGTMPYSYDSTIDSSRFSLTDNPGMVDWSMFDDLINEDAMQGFTNYPMFDDKYVQNQWQMRNQQL